MTTLRDRREPIGAISLESRGSDRLALSYALAPEAWGKGYASEAVESMVDAAFALTRAVEVGANVRVENPSSRRVLEKAGFQFVGTGPQGAPARGGLVDCDRLQIQRAAWVAARGSMQAVSLGSSPAIESPR